MKTQGIRDALPLLFGIMPFGITCGIMGTAIGLTPGEVILMAVLVFAGSAQFIGITMIGAGAGAWGIVFTTLLVNLRHLLMGASLAPHMSSQPFPKQAFLSFFLTDESYALTISEIERHGYHSAYHMCVSLTLYICWVLFNGIGAFAGSYISDPMAWGLDFAMPATFMVLLFPRLIQSVDFIVCGISALVSVLGALFLPGKWYIIVACLIASLLGGLLEGEQSCTEK